MDAFEHYQQAQDVMNGQNKLANINASCQVIKAKCLELNAMYADWEAKVAAGTYSQEDLDALDRLREGLTALFTAVNTYLNL